jgi:hypothetical protein
MSEKQLRFIKSVDNLPIEARSRDSYYDEILREFFYSGTKYAQVKDIGKKPLAVLLGIKNRLKTRKETVHVYLRKGKVYLERIEIPEQTKLPQKYNETPITINNNLNYDVIKLLNNSIVKARCARCKTLNAKDARTCRECKHNLYSTEQEYQASLKDMESLERSLNQQLEITQETTNTKR